MPEVPPDGGRNLVEHDDGGDIGVKEGDYVVSISRRGFRRLHRAGACHFVPGVGYSNFEIMGSSRPGLEEYDDFCRRCFGAEIPLSPESTLSSGSSSESA